MSKNWLKKFNKSVLKKKTPLLGFTVLELFILFVVISGGTTAIVVNRYQQTSKQDTSANLPTYETNNSGQSTIKIAEPDQVTSENTTQDSSATQNTTTNNTPKVDPNSLPDKYGCVPNSSGYENCVKYAKQNEKYFQCSELERAANSKYSTQIDKAKAAYDAVLAEWPAAEARMKQQNYPQHWITSEHTNFMNDAKTKYNAISKPAYAEYVSTLNSIRSQGCQVTQLHSDYSWAGY